jgi:hypothetical protein
MFATCRRARTLSLGTTKFLASRPGAGATARSDRKALIDTSPDRRCRPAPRDDSDSKMHRVIGAILRSSCPGLSRASTSYSRRDLKKRRGVAGTSPAMTRRHLGFIFDQALNRRGVIYLIDIWEQGRRRLDRTARICSPSLRTNRPPCAALSRGLPRRRPRFFPALRASAKQSRFDSPKRKLDCFVARAPRNDGVRYSSNTFALATRGARAVGGGFTIRPARFK